MILVQKTMEHCDNIIFIQIKSYLEGHKDMINNIRYCTGLIKINDKKGTYLWG